MTPPPVAPPPGPPAQTAASRLAEVQATIARAAQDARRPPADVTLIAVSKTHGADAIHPLIAAGQRHFGENRVQEAAAKWPAIRETAPDLALHMIGQLQSNKAEDAAALFDVIHTLDRPSLLTALVRAMDKHGRRLPCFVQVDLAGEPHKGGVAPAGLAALIASARAADIPLLGLMTVPPVGLEPAPWFALLAKLADDHGLPGLSMGMSGDYPTAVRLGATHIRVGSALFGARD
jgi:PLP dependent protein